jgi:chromosome partitioning protein
MIIPSLAESTSQRAVELMLDQRARLNLEYEQTVREIAAVANRIEQTNEAKKMRKWFRTVFDDVPLFFVRKRVAFQRAYNEGVSLFEYNPNCDMCLPFKNLGRTVLETFESGR